VQNIRVFVVDDHPICRRGLAAMIENFPAYQLAGEAGSGPELEAAIAAAEPHVVVLDMSIPGTDSLATLQTLAARWPALRWVLLAETADVPLARQGLALGASAVLLKSASQQDVLDGLQAAAQGRTMCSAALHAALVTPTQADEPGADLTQRERELLALLARGLGNGDISARLAIAVPTVKFHITNIMSKLQAANRTAAVLVALRHNIVRLD
jgi:two-component system, NarL family, response regulator LiaR